MSSSSSMTGVMPTADVTFRSGSLTSSTVSLGSAATPLSPEAKEKGHLHLGHNTCQIVLIVYVQLQQLHYNWYHILSR